MGRFAVAGPTSWGLTLTWLLARNGHDVALLCRTESEADQLRQERSLARFPAVVLPANVTPCTANAAPECEGLVVAVPAQSFRAAAASLERFRDIPALSGAKGIEHGSHLRMTQVLVACGWREELVAALSGPNLAREIAAGLPAAAVVAAGDEANARLWQTALSGSSFRIYRGEDIAGVEFGGALKNVVAIAAAACAELGLGANAMAAVITRGLAEITRLGVALGAHALTFQGLAGVGDLVATCMSPLSRNHQLGSLLARGKAFDEAMKEIRETVEGAETAPVAREMAHAAGIEMPITEQVCAVLEGRTDVRTAMSALLARAVTAEPA